ncbi:MAG: 1,4-alpha-glucan branching enzyme, partial [Mycobacterium sp.]
MTRQLMPEPADLARLLAGEHHDPHAILGAHEYDGVTVVRFLRPRARRVVVLAGPDRFAMRHLGSGVFAVSIQVTGLLDYR